MTLCQVADRHRAYTQVQFFSQIGGQTLLGDNCLVSLDPLLTQDDLKELLRRLESPTVYG
jgi:hypothetical protein